MLSAVNFIEGGVQTSNFFSLFLNLFKFLATISDQEKKKFLLFPLQVTQNLLDLNVVN